MFLFACSSCPVLHIINISGFSHIFVIWIFPFLIGKTLCNLYMSFKKYLPFSIFSVHFFDVMQSVNKHIFCLLNVFFYAYLTYSGSWLLSLYSYIWTILNLPLWLFIPFYIEWSIIYTLPWHFYSFIYIMSIISSVIHSWSRFPGMTSTADVTKTSLGMFQFKYPLSFNSMPFRLMNSPLCNSKHQRVCCILI